MRVDKKMEYIKTPVSGLEVPYRGRWKNAIFVREYHRVKRREKFNTPEDKLRKTYNPLFPEQKRVLTDYDKYYKPSAKIYCPFCHIDIFQGRWRAHLASVKHAKHASAILDAVSP
jgi:hypothetical protein